MRKSVICAIALVMVVCLLCGCGSAPTLPKLDISTSTLTGVVEYVNGRTIRISVTEGDSHYDAATEKYAADVIHVTYTTLDGSQSVQIGDTVTFTYSYTRDVSERNNDPHITVNKITVK